MIGRKKNKAQEVSSPTPQEPLPTEVVGKGRPTPTRKEREAARQRPLISADPKADKKAARAKMNEQRRLAQIAMETGDERHMPAQHRGPGRRYARDYVDARWGLGEFFMPAAMIAIVLLLISVMIDQPEIFFILVVGLYLLVIIALVESIIIASKIRKKITEKFGEGRTRGVRMYVISRAMQLRRARLPKPMVKRGEYPK